MYDPVLEHLTAHPVTPPVLGRGPAGLIRSKRLVPKQPRLRYVEKQDYMTINF